MSKHFVSLPISMITLKRNGPNGPYGPAMNSFFSMPFGSHARIQIINQSEMPVENLFYHIDYELYDEPIPADMGRFHATWNRENPCKAVPQPVSPSNAAADLAGVNLTGEENYVALEATGKGI